MAKRLDEVPNKSAFIARAVVERFKELNKLDVRRKRLAAYRYTAAHPEVEKDGSPDW